MRTRLSILLAGLVVGGCGPIKKPESTKHVVRPTAEVVAVRLVETSAVAARYDVDVTLTNPNDVALPLNLARYRVKIDDGEYASDTIPLKTLPAMGQITLSLPAVIEDADGDESPTASAIYETSGRVTYTPPGQIRQFFYELGIPRPKASFSGSGDVDTVGSAMLDGARGSR